MALSVTGFLFPLKMRCPVCAKKNTDHEKNCRSCGHVFTPQEQHAGFAEARRRRVKYGVILSGLVVTICLLQIIVARG